MRTNNFNICIETQKTPSGQNNLRKKNRAGGITLLDFWLYCKATVINAVWDWQRNRCTDQHDRTHSPEINPHTYGQLSHNKGGKNTQQRKHSLFNKRCWENWTATCKIMKLEQSLTPYTKVNSKYIKDLNVQLDIIKFLEENIGRTLFDINGSNTFFLDLSPKQKTNKESNGT